MLNIPDGLKEEFLTDSTNKNIVVPFTDAVTDVSGVNWYTGFVAYGINGHLDAPGDLILYSNYDGVNWSTILDNYVYKDYLQEAEYVYISFKLTVISYTELPTTMRFSIHGRNSSGVNYGAHPYPFNPNDYLDKLTSPDGMRVYTRVRSDNIEYFKELAIYCQSGGIDWSYGVGDIQIESSNVLYTKEQLYDGDATPLPYLGESIIRQGLDPADYVTIGKDPINDITNDDIEIQKFTLQENMCSSNNMKFGACEASYVNFTVYNRNEDFKGREISPYITTDPEDIQARIPLGVYGISEVKKSEAHGLSKVEITAYDRLTLLEQNAANWYKLYMYAFDTRDYNKAFDFQFVRQIYSSYFNIMKNLGIERRTNYEEIVIQDHSDYWSDVQSAEYGKEILYQVAPNRNAYVQYKKYTVNSPDTSRPYVVDLTNYNNQTDEELKTQCYDYREFVDADCRGVVGTANVLIVEYTNGNEHCFVVDSGDYFMLSPGCDSFEVHFPWISVNELHDQNTIIITGAVKISKVDKEIDLTNASKRLIYYGWQSKVIFDCDSSITARDVVRSLLEVCGCFFKLDRYGMPTFLYPTMNALYPSNTLYPDDNLYPRGLDGSLLPMGRYKSFTYEDYQVQNIGRIQIIKNINTNDVTSICEWEYEGDPDAINTYLIDNNIFYCNKDLIYDYDNMGDLAQMLVNMYNRISNMRYYPHLTEAIGMPWVEVGDRIGLLTSTGGIESFVYRRTLKGIQLLSDKYEAQGDEYTEKVKDYNYSIWEG